MTDSLLSSVVVVIYEPQNPDQHRRDDPRDEEHGHRRAFG